MIGNIDWFSSAAAKRNRGCTAKVNQYSGHPLVLKNLFKGDGSLLSHLLLLFLPLTRLQVEKGIDLLLLSLRIRQLQDIVIDRLSSARRSSIN